MRWRWGRQGDLACAAGLLVWGGRRLDRRPAPCSTRPERPPLPAWVAGRIMRRDAGGVCNHAARRGTRPEAAGRYPYADHARRPLTCRSATGHYPTRDGPVTGGGTGGDVSPMSCRIGTEPATACGGSHAGPALRQPFPEGDRTATGATQHAAWTDHAFALFCCDEKKSATPYGWLIMCRASPRHCPATSDGTGHRIRGGCMPDTTRDRVAAIPP